MYDVFLVGLAILSFLAGCWVQEARFKRTRNSPRMQSIASQVAGMLFRYDHRESARVKLTMEPARDDFIAFTYTLSVDSRYEDFTIVVPRSELYSKGDAAIQQTMLKLRYLEEMDATRFR